MKSKFALSLALGACALFSVAFAGEIEPQLEAAFKAAPAGALHSAIVHVAGGADAKALKGAGASRAAILRAIRAEAAASQAGVAAALADLRDEGRVFESKAYWGFNGFVVTADQTALRKIAARADVRAVTLNKAIRRPDPVEPGPAPKVAETNLQIANVPQVWNSLGVTGAGVLVANMDAGVDGTHPALSGKYRGTMPGHSHADSWFDPVDGTTVPSTSEEHGTRTMGIMVAGDGDAGADPNDVGVAYNATWIAVRIFGNGSTTDAVIHAGYQFLMDPDDNPATDDLPDVVNNSWGYTGTGCILEYQTDLANLEALGVINVFSAGNSGPGAGSWNSPANNSASTISVASTNNAKAISSFSSRGPNPCTGETGPDISAAGEAIRSTIPGGGYAGGSNGTGTSFSGPTVAGIVALMVEANPALAHEQAKSILIATAEDLGAPGLDNDYGHGFVDAFAAVSNVLSPSPSVTVFSRTIDDAAGGCTANGSVEPGESIVMPVTLRNGGLLGATGVTATLSTSDPLVTIDQGSASFGSIAPGATAGSAVPHFAWTVAASKPAFSTVDFDVAITANEGAWADTISVPVGDYAVSGVPYSFTDATGGTALSLTDDSSQSASLGFTFSLYGAPVSSVYVSSNGFLATGPAGASEYVNGSIPSASAPNGLLSPLWDDLNPAAGGTVHVLQTGAAPHRRFIAQWTGVPHYGGANGVTFQAVLEEGGGVQFNYADVDFGDASQNGGASATVGVEDAAGARGIQYSMNAATLSANQSIRFETASCAPPVCTDGDGDGYNVEGGACGPIDCDDGDAGVNPGAAENCANGIDDDCDGDADAADADCGPSCTDADGDGYNVEGGACGAVDCNDGNAAVNPGASEVPGNGVDDDCNAGTPDCPDADGDGYSTGGGVCGAVDCNDGNAAVNPGATEIPGNGVDDDCNPGTPGGCPPQPQSAEAGTLGGGAGERASDLAFYVLPLLAIVLGMRRRRRQGRRRGRRRTLSWG